MFKHWRIPKKTDATPRPIIYWKDGGKPTETHQPLVLIVDGDVTQGIAFKLQQPKTIHRLHCECMYSVHSVYFFDFLRVFRSSFFFPGTLRVSFLSLLFFLPYSILPVSLAAFFAYSSPILLSYPLKQDK